MTDKQPEALRLAKELDCFRINDETLLATVAELRRLCEMETKYCELLYAVSIKWEGESRHQTALRYIQNAESTTGNAVAKAVGEQQ